MLHAMETVVISSTVGCLWLERDLTQIRNGTDKVCVQTNGLNEQGGSLIPALSSGFCNMKQLRALLFPLGGMLVRRRLAPNIFVRLT